MAAKDFYHDKLKNALIKDGWLVTHDPYIIDIPEMRPRQEIDLGAEKIIGAERGVDKIAVEVKSFLNASLVYDFHHALGQFMLYLIGLEIKEPNRHLYLAIPVFAYNYFESMRLIQLGIEKYQVKLIIFDHDNETIESWIN